MYKGAVSNGQDGNPGDRGLRYRHLQNGENPVPNKSTADILAESNDMTPVAGTIDVDIPIKELWESFTHAHLWARWNKCFFGR